MIKKLPLFCCIIFFAFLSLANNSYAGDIRPAGAVLEEESYVFTIAEATNLKKQIEDLEKDLAAASKELNKYKELEEVRLQQIDFYVLNEGFYLSQISRYKDLQLLDRNLLDKYRKRDRLQTVENIGFLSLGVALTIGSFLLADGATDLAISTSP
jgi:hypothetical protein